MGLIRTLISIHQQNKTLEESKRQFDEDQKLKKAQLEVNRANLMRNLADATTMLSSGSPLLKSLQGEGINPDYGGAVFGQGEGGGSAQIPVQTSLVGELMKRRTGELEEQAKFQPYEKAGSILDIDPSLLSLQSKEGIAGLTQKKYPEKYPPEEEKLTLDERIFNDWQKAHPDEPSENFYRVKEKPTTKKTDYGKALDYANYEYALRGVNKDELNRVDLHNMAKEIESGDMQVSDEAKAIEQIMKKNPKTIDWMIVSQLYPGIDTVSVRKALKSLGKKY